MDHLGYALRSYVNGLVVELFLKANVPIRQSFFVIVTLVVIS